MMILLGILVLVITVQALIMSLVFWKIVFINQDLMEAQRIINDLGELPFKLNDIRCRRPE